jgi:hypothetical protein
MPRPSHLSRFYHPNKIWWSVQVMKLLIMQSPPASRHFLPLGPNILLSTLFSTPLTPCYSVTKPLSMCLSPQLPLFTFCFYI